MKSALCSVDWTISNGVPVCNGSLSSVEAVPNPSGIVAEDIPVLTGHALELFAVIAGALLIRRAIR